MGILLCCLRSPDTAQHSDWLALGPVMYSDVLELKRLADWSNTNVLR